MKKSGIKLLDKEKINNWLEWAIKPEKSTRTKLQNTGNPFSFSLEDLDIGEKEVIESTSDSIVEIITKLMRTSPAEEKENQQRAQNYMSVMIQMLLLAQYEKEIIRENIEKYTHKTNKDDFYYMVKEIKMTEEEYQRYLEKEKVHYNLTKNLKSKHLEKKVKL